MNLGFIPGDSANETDLVLSWLFNFDDLADVARPEIEICDQLAGWIVPRHLHVLALRHKGADRFDCLGLWDSCHP